MTRVEIPTVFEYLEEWAPNTTDVNVYHLYSCRRQLENWCQTHYITGSYHITIQRINMDQFNAIKATIFIDFKNDDDAVHFKLCYLDKT